MDRKNVKLDFPSLETFDSYIEALEEGYHIGIQPRATRTEIEVFMADPAAHLAKLNEQRQGSFTAPDGSEHPFVPHEMLWLTDGGAFIGGVSFRLKLSALLRDFGGHVGYGIRPKYERQGYGSLALALVKDRAIGYGIDRLRLTCHEGNLASEKIISNNGGVYEDTVGDIYGFSGPTKRFWIDLCLSRSKPPPPA